MLKPVIILTVTALSVVTFTGCTAPHTSKRADVTSSTEYRELQRELAVAKANGSRSSADAKASGNRTSALETEIARLQKSGSGSSSSSLLPPNPKAGECYARVVIPATYKTTRETVQVIAPSERIEITEPVYRMVEERVLATEQSSRLEVVPATYKTVTEIIEVSPESEQLVRVPATYKNITKKIKISDARTEWKKGTGPIQRIDDATGEIMCLVEIPAQYRTVTNRVIATPESVRTIAIASKTKEVTRRVVDQVASTRTIDIPATYKTIKVRKLVSPASQRVIAIAGEDSTVTKRAIVTDSYLEWRSILCETNTTPNVIRSLQLALKSKGFNPGPADGIYGKATQEAVTKYQISKKIASGKLTIDTLKKLGVH